MLQENNDFHSQFLRFGIDLGFLVSGFFGALILSIKKKKQKLSKQILCIATGTICANFLTPLVLNFAPQSLQQNGKYAVAFMMGYIGLKGLEEISEIVMNYIESKKPKTPTP
jgi:hypothetical protein